MTPAALRYEFDDYDLASFLPRAAGFGTARFGYVVTPNVDHLVRFHDDAEFRAYYASADFVLLDSRFAARLLRLVKRIRLPVCTGSDLTAALLREVIVPRDRVVLIGGDADRARAIARSHDLQDVRHYNPPMGFIQDPASVEKCLEFIEAQSPFRFCFLAVGSPQQEAVAQRLKTRGRARGLALCVGASLDFITGVEKRAPVWVQRAALEWLWRLAQNPRRLARRYLIRGPRVFGQLARARVTLRSTDRR